MPTKLFIHFVRQFVQLIIHSWVLFGRSEVKIVRSELHSDISVHIDIFLRETHQIVLIATNHLNFLHS
jgi:hypothetical protein